jgi:hypothetical protein
MGQPNRGVEGLATRHQAVDQTHPEGLFALDAPASQSQVDRVTMSGEPRTSPSGQGEERRCRVSVEAQEVGKSAPE